MGFPSFDLAAFEAMQGGARLAGAARLRQLIDEGARRVDVENAGLQRHDHLVGDLDEEGEALGGAEVQALRDGRAEVLGAGGTVNLKGLKYG